MGAADDFFANLPKPPIEAPADLRQLAQANWQTYNAFVAVGFTPDHAIQLTTTFLAGVLMGQFPMPDGDE